MCIPIIYVHAEMTSISLLTSDFEKIDVVRVRPSARMLECVDTCAHVCNGMSSSVSIDWPATNIVPDPNETRTLFACINN